MNSFSPEITPFRQAYKDPFRLFEEWYKEAGKFTQTPEAMVLSTCSPGLVPSSRVVLLKHHNEEGFTFYTNYNSRKGTDILHNPHVALNFYWPEQARQVRIEGIAEKTSPEISDAYFASRDRESQIGAWASAQSEEIASRTHLEENVREVSDRFAGRPVSRPPHWGGFCVRPERIEFWQSRPARLHDRTVFIRTPGNRWDIILLSP
jgi:pyridoxamine 5'-phosphate oxidase